MYELLLNDFQSEIVLKERAGKITIGNKQREKLQLDESGEVKTIAKEVVPPVVETPVAKVTPPPVVVETPPVVPEPPVVVEVPKEEPKALVEEPKVEAPKVEVAKVEEKTPEPIVVVTPVEETKPEVVAPIVVEEPIKEATKEQEAPKTPEAPAAKKEEEPKEVAKPIEEKPAETDNSTLKVIGKIDLDSVAKKKTKPKERPAQKPIDRKKKENKKPAAKVEPKKQEPVKPVVKTKAPPKELEHIATKKIELTGPKVVGKIVLPVAKPKKDASKGGDGAKRKRKRVFKKTKVDPSRPRTGQGGNQRGRGNTANTEKQIQDKIKATMAKLSGGSKKSSRAKLRKQKREVAAQHADEVQKERQSEDLQVTEFISVSELASLMEVSVNQVISACFSLGTIVTINQRLDAEIIEIVAEEFGHKVKFVDLSEQEEEEEEIIDAPEDLVGRAPIVTIMGHVDHGKTSLLDYIRSTNVIAGEAGGITQHIGAYEVTTDAGKKITFLDTPGHEAFTAMRARGAKITDIAVIVIAADDAVMPQTKEAISHAQAAQVPIIFAFNKIDKDGANPDRLKEQLANMNLLVESWGGTIQAEEISAKNGTNIDSLMEKILLEAEMLELKANPKRNAIGAVVEASLDKGRGFVSNLLVQTGTLKVGDFILSGYYYGKVKAMFNERGGKMDVAGPSQPVTILGLNGAPQAGENFRIYDSESEAKSKASRREQIVREQGIRTKKHITLDEIGRRLALGNFKELNLIVKGDVDGSIEALSDSLQKLSTEEIQINIIHKSVGQISESDVLLASASDAIIIGFQVRPSSNARKMAENENIDVRLYSIIYDAIEEIKSAMEGMLEPTIEEKFLCNVEIRDVFKVSKVGTVAGCFVTEGKVYRDAKVRVVREGIVAFTGELSSLKRYKDDVKEVTSGMECGLTIKNFNDIKVGDIIEGYTEVEVKRTL
ncbi:UNVERIFIED_CONTAM: hypothetical protein GTU68_063567 [Idotea baltica]|nr:hypothetical protein [Idotea baltica]